MKRWTWFLVAVVLAGLVPWDEARAVRVERRWGPSGSSAAPARSGRVTRWRDTSATMRRPADEGPAARVRGPAGIVHGPGGTERVLRDREPEGAARVEVQIGRTRRLLDLVRDRAERCGSAEARDAVRRAVEMQERAESAARAGRRLGALQLTRGAREQGIAALRHCGHTGRAPEGVVSALGRTDEMLRLEREQQAERPVPAGARAETPERGADGRAEALQRAAEAQRRAQAEFRDGRLESSLRLTHEARQALRQGTRRESGARRDGAVERGGTERGAPARETPRRETTSRARPKR